MRLVSTIETDLALYTRQYIGANFAKTQYLDKKIAELNKELECSKIYFDLHRRIDPCQK